MPDRSHARWRPAYGSGPIGEAVGRSKVKTEPPTHDGDANLGRSAILRPYQVKHKSRSESSDDETGAVSRYANPTGFHGLYGNDVDKNWWQKDSGVREPKKRTGPGINPLRGMPFKSRGR